MTRPRQPRYAVKPSQPRKVSPSGDARFPPACTYAHPCRIRAGDFNLTMVRGVYISYLVALARIRAGVLVFTRRPILWNRLFLVDVFFFCHFFVESAGLVGRSNEFHVRVRRHIHPAASTPRFRTLSRHNFILGVDAECKCGVRLPAELGGHI